MTVLSFLGTIAAYGWVIVTLLLGVLLEVSIVLLCFGEWRDRKKANENLDDCDIRAAAAEEPTALPSETWDDLNRS